MMLSKIDIYREMGKELCLYPFIPENIKENSINVSTSEYAWTQNGGTVYWYGGIDFQTVSIKGNPRHTHTFKPRQRSVFITKNHDGIEKKYIILFPHQTTNIETLEVIGIGTKLGGAVHSKVGIVSKGIGDFGTMLGPGYCGHLLISLHNITDNIIALEIGETFGSLTFEYLKTPVIRESTTSSSHYDKLLELDLSLTPQDREYFKEDWKVTFKGIKEKMLVSAEYKEQKDKYPDNLKTKLKERLCLRNVILILGAIGFIVGLYFLANHLDKGSTEKWWMNLYINGILMTIIIAVIEFYKSLFKK